MDPELDQIRDQQRETWDRFSVGWQQWDTFVRGWLSPVGEAMIRQANLRQDAHILDVATGTGEPGLTAAGLVPQGQVTLTDLSEGMLKVASDTAAERGLANVATHVCDASDLPFGESTFDAVFCRFGFMFFPDVYATATELARVSRPGARITVAVWGKPETNPWATTVMATIARQVALPATPPGAPGLFRCAAEGYVQDVFRRVGLRDVTEEEVSFSLVQPTAEDYWEFMTACAAPVVAGLALADAATQQSIRSEVLDLAHRQVSDGQVRLRSTALVVSGTR